MIENKYCIRCNKHISNINTDDYYSFIRIKYCPECKPIVKKEQTLKCIKESRQRKKEQNRLRDIQLDLLKKENELLRLNIIKLKENLI